MKMFESFLRLLQRNRRLLLREHGGKRSSRKDRTPKQPK